GDRKDCKGDCKGGDCFSADIPSEIPSEMDMPSDSGGQVDAGGGGGVAGGQTGQDENVALAGGASSGKDEVSAGDGAVVGVVEQPGTSGDPVTRQHPAVDMEGDNEAQQYTQVVSRSSSPARQLGGKGAASAGGLPDVAVGLAFPSLGASRMTQFPPLRPTTSPSLA
ncbi:unnamed protein product, partial [Amoebophrya sp. A25]